MSAFCCRPLQCCHLPSSLLRRALTAHLNDFCDEADVLLAPRKAETFGIAEGVVLEIGAGAGTNRKYLHDADKYVALEPESAFHDRLARVADAVLQARAEAIPLPTASVDSVICSMVLCSVRNLHLAVAEICRVLRPGGRLLLLEHVAAPPGTMLHLCQRISKPVCIVIDLGCRPDSNTATTIRSSGLRIKDYSEFQLKLTSPLIRDWISATMVKPHFAT